MITDIWCYTDAGLYFVWSSDKWAPDVELPETLTKEMKDFMAAADQEDGEGDLVKYSLRKE